MKMGESGLDVLQQRLTRRPRHDDVNDAIPESLQGQHESTHEYDGDISLTIMRHGIDAIRTGRDPSDKNGCKIQQSALGIGPSGILVFVATAPSEGLRSRAMPTRFAPHGRRLIVTPWRPAGQGAIAISGYCRPGAVINRDLGAGARREVVIRVEVVDLFADLENGARRGNVDGKGDEDHGPRRNHSATQSGSDKKPRAWLTTRGRTRLRCAGPRHDWRPSTITRHLHRCAGRCAGQRDM